MIGNAVGCERIQTRTEHSKILTDNDGGHARRINFNHYIVDSKLTIKLEREQESERDTEEEEDLEDESWYNRHGRTTRTNSRREKGVGR